jgi:hypothetical protein
MPPKNVRETRAVMRIVVPAECQIVEITRASATALRTLRVPHYWSTAARTGWPKKSLFLASGLGTAKRGA